MGRGSADEHARDISAREPVGQSEPSEAAIAIAADSVLEAMDEATDAAKLPACADVRDYPERPWIGGHGYAKRALQSAHDPKLGLDRSVRLADVVQALDVAPEDEPAAEYIERHFTT